MGLDSAAIAEEGGDDEEEEASSPRYGFCGVRIAGASFLEGRVQVHTAGSTTVGLRRAWTITGGKAFMYSTNFRISKKYNLFRNRPVIYNLYEIKL
jgi:hypothetical protein